MRWGLHAHSNAPNIRMILFDCGQKIERMQLVRRMWRKGENHNLTFAASLQELAIPVTAQAVQ
jgi:hypothetical protein